MKRNIRTINLSHIIMDDQTFSQESLFPLEKKEENTAYLIEVIPGLFLGNYKAASNEKLLSENKIEVIFNLVESLENRFPDNIVYHNFKISDSSNFTLDERVSEINVHLHNYLSNNRRVLVHCRQGISRSPSVIIAFLIKFKDFSFEQAFSFVRSKAKNIEPNFGFLAQLQKM